MKSIKKIRENILKALNVASYDQINKAKFADSIGVSHENIKKIVSGATKNPGIDTVVAIAKRLNISIDELVGYQPTNKKRATLLSTDLMLNIKLLESTIIYILSYIKEQNLSPNMGMIINIFDDIYHYSHAKNLDHPHDKFATWILKSTLES